MDNSTTHRSSDALLTDDLKARLVRARKASNDAVARGDIPRSLRWVHYGNDALMAGRDFATTALFAAAKGFFESGRSR